MFKMSDVLVGQFRPIITEKVYTNRAKAKKAIQTLKGLNTRGILNSPGVTRNHQIVHESTETARRWEAIARKVL